MICRRYQKLTQYLHVSDRANEPAQNSADYDKLYKIHPVLNMVQHSFAESYKPWQNQTTEEGMIAFKERLSYVQHLPAKPIKRGIMVWMSWNANTAYLHQFEAYLGWQKNSSFGLWYDMMMKLCKDISRKYHHVYCDNLFISVQLLKALLAHKTYCNGTIHLNMKYLPECICKLGRIIHGTYKSYQDDSSNLVTTVCQDNRIVRCVSMDAL